MLKQNLSPYEKGMVLVFFAVISVILEAVFIYQYVTTGVVKFSPTAIIRGDGAFYFIILAGVLATGFLPYAINQFRVALKEDM